MNHLWGDVRATPNYVCVGLIEHMHVYTDMCIRHVHMHRQAPTDQFHAQRHEYTDVHVHTHTHADTATCVHTRQKPRRKEETEEEPSYARGGACGPGPGSVPTTEKQAREHLKANCLEGTPICEGRGWGTDTGTCDPEASEDGNTLSEEGP